MQIDEKADEKRVHESSKDAARKGSAKANLHELCTQKHWKQPEFECCKEEDFAHRKLFTFKVVIEIEESPKQIVECFGNARTSKKAAADNAAEGVLWCLRHKGYDIKKKSS